MESIEITTDYGVAARVTHHGDTPRVLVVCEHASNHIPARLHGLGLDDAARRAHVAWDPGALAVARLVAQELGAVLVEGGLSRLVYDCNRPPEAESAVPARSEVYDIPGNQNLSPAARAERVAQAYEPFRAALAQQIAQHRFETMVTVHSFTPVYHGEPRAVEIGVLHGEDPALAKTMMACAPEGYVIRLNEPYAPRDGVAHTLDLHGAANSLPNVMIELRNDLIQDAAGQEKAAATLVPWLREATQ